MARSKKDADVENNSGCSAANICGSMMRLSRLALVTHVDSMASCLPQPSTALPAAVVVYCRC